jgi:hypothetical protein
VPTGSQVHRDFLHRPVTTSCFNFYPIQLLFLLLACEDFIHACLGQVSTIFFALDAISARAARVLGRFVVYRSWHVSKLIFLGVLHTYTSCSVKYV